MVDLSTASPERLGAQTNPTKEDVEDQLPERSAKRARTSSRSRSPTSPRKRSRSGSPARSRSPLQKKRLPEEDDSSKEQNESKEPEEPEEAEESEESEEPNDQKKQDEEEVKADTADNAAASTGSGSSSSSYEEGERESSPEEGEFIPPLPEGPPPEDPPSDGWEAIWEDSVGAYYFYNHITKETTWTNPRVPEAPNPVYDAAAGSVNGELGENGEAVAPAAYQKPPRERYNPAIHGDYDPTAPYAQRSPTPEEDPYAAQAAFNRFTGKFQGPGRPTANSFTDENKAKKQMEFYFDVDAAANSHDGRSLKAERQSRKLTKQEVKAFRDKRRERKEEKRRAWLKD